MINCLSKEIDPEFSEILWRALDGRKLTVDEGERLFKAKATELLALIQTADEIRRRQVGNVGTYVVNRNINFTNICIGSCKFCAFSRRKGSQGAYVLTTEEISNKVKEAVKFGATEVCIQGGLHPDFRMENYLEILRAVRSVSEDIHIHAFSPEEINYMARREELPVKEVIKALQDEGLNSVPGTAAEILVDRVRKVICPQKVSVERWREIIETCHRLGLPTTATMLYGHIETMRERAQHLVFLREIQGETWGFTEFIPLGFMHRNTRLERAGFKPWRNAIDDFRMHAVARLMLTNYIDNIQASWVKLGPRLAQAMLRAGANDLSGTLMEENISRAAGGCVSRMMPRQLEELISGAGLIPRQRTTTYELL
ncbi:MAG: 5-amino-6-(D-ribitylamino)uracil--L-tyrosine 4-hydroxyphenyl transferase CofH [Hadesarchaea archaeon]|nr:5-amino-6-(D-ribitylamino)uracil--L-tyrosine 4-hydroxyphenyl transferase CofH [Hadesarchaea archaeon]